MESTINTFTVDCGGGGIKASVVDEQGALLVPRLRIPTPYPLPPGDFVDLIANMRTALERDSHRASVGIPGMIRHGIVRFTPHYVTESGPFSSTREALVRDWRDFDAQSALASRLGIPTCVVNDAELAGAGVIAGSGFEVVMTLGTGVGFALFNDGALLPKIEISQAWARTDVTLDQWLGAHQRKLVGTPEWCHRVVAVVAQLRRVFFWDRLYLGGGNAKKIDSASAGTLGTDVTLVGNAVALRGGPALWS